MIDLDRVSAAFLRKGFKVSSVLLGKKDVFSEEEPKVCRRKQEWELKYVFLVVEAFMALDSAQDRNIDFLRKVSRRPRRSCRFLMQRSWTDDDTLGDIRLRSG
ncbi:MAG: hypothetical protein E2590_05585 [Chryseobacterium sp.]|nr:hypothetical protein [Chryseobacterium sp.]